jgi:hypothetical protein
MAFQTRIALVGMVAAASSCNFFTPYAGDQLGETLVKAECHFVHACCTAGEWDNPALAGFTPLMVYRSESECVAEETEQGTNNWFGISGTAIRQAEQAGRFSFDNTTAGLCLQSRIDAANKCDADVVIGDAAEPVDPVLCDFSRPPGEGKVADEGNCYFSWECATKGSQCVRPIDLEDIDNIDEPSDTDPVIIQSAGVCVPPVQEGDSCEPNEDTPNFFPNCEPGHFCLLDRGDFTCEALRAEGDDCDGGDCEPGLYCDRECTALKPDGDNCDFAFECESAVCNSDDECGGGPVEVQICNGVQGAADTTYADDGVN